MSNVDVHQTERNLTAYKAAASLLAHQLRDRGFGEVLLTPGDATAYPFVILPAGRIVQTVREDGWGPDTKRRDYLVILAASFGKGYEWSGQTMSWDYCAEKWTTDRHEWTGRVVCLLLNHLSPLLPKVSS